MEGPSRSHTLWKRWIMRWSSPSSSGRRLVMLRRLLPWTMSESAGLPWTVAKGQDTFTPISAVPLDCGLKIRAIWFCFDYIKLCHRPIFFIEDKSIPEFKRSDRKEVEICQAQLVRSSNAKGQKPLFPRIFRHEAAGSTKGATDYKLKVKRVNMILENAQIAGERGLRVERLLHGFSSVQLQKKWSVAGSRARWTRLAKGETGLALEGEESFAEGHAEGDNHPYNECCGEGIEGHEGRVHRPLLLHDVVVEHQQPY
ncbi:hypothetical protein Cni_G13546 [Canna indica]|uniref:Uncharacterized protein n=1 Tax=Canna indica TaxID=4628 RepID=A0AAQ3KA28_9LILI|nr:hypothetical protein Cni_G13546 [Canna indica]